MDANTLARQVRNRRQALQWSQEKLAAEAGLSREYIARMETSKVDNVSISSLEKLAAALGCAPSQLTEESQDAETRVVIHPSLSEFAREESLSVDEMLSLAKIEFRGARPQTAKEWQALYQVVKKLRRK